MYVNMIPMMNVKELRNSLNFTQEDLARKLDVTIQTIRRWEKGQKRIHKAHQRRLDRLARKVQIAKDKEIR